MDKPDKREVLKRQEGNYFLDYALVTGAVRVYVIQELEEHFKADPNDLHRRMFLMAVYREEYSAYEDLGAFLDAFLTHQVRPQVPPLERLISYGPGQVELARVMARFGVTTAAQLYDGLGLDGLIPTDFNDEFPKLNLEGALRVASSYFFDDCVRNQKKAGIQAFNKFKHGLLVVPSARLYHPELIDAPAAYLNHPKAPETATMPVSLYAVPMEDGHLKQRIDSLHFIQANLRMIAALFVVTQYPKVITTRRFAKPLDIFRTGHLTDVVNFIEQVSNRVAD